MYIALISTAKTAKLMLENEIKVTKNNIGAFKTRKANAIGYYNDDSINYYESVLVGLESDLKLVDESLTSMLSAL